MTKRELVSREEEEEEECLTKSLSRRPTSKAGAPLPGHPGTQAAAAEGAIHILVCDARRAAEPALLRNMLTFSRGRCWGRGTSTNILDTSRLRGEIALLDSTVEKMGSRARPPFNPSSCPTGWRDGSKQQQQQRVFGSSSLTGRKLPLEAAAGRQQQLEGHGRDTATRAASRVGDAPNY